MPKYVIDSLYQLYQRRVHICTLAVSASSPTLHHHPCEYQCTYYTTCDMHAPLPVPQYSINYQLLWGSSCNMVSRTSSLVIEILLPVTVDISVLYRIRRDTPPCIVLTCNKGRYKSSCPGGDHEHIHFSQVHNPVLCIVASLLLLENSISLSYQLVHKISGQELLVLSL